MDKEEKKRLTEEFKKTDFGKKEYNKNLICTVVFGISVILEIVFFNSDGWFYFINFCTDILFCVSMYFEGHYYGSLKHYIHEHSKK